MPTWRRPPNTKADAASPVVSRARFASRMLSDAGMKGFRAPVEKKFLPPGTGNHVAHPPAPQARALRRLLPRKKRLEALRGFVLHQGDDRARTPRQAREQIADLRRLVPPLSRNDRFDPVPVGVQAQELRVVAQEKPFAVADGQPAGEGGPVLPAARGEVSQHVLEIVIGAHADERGHLLPHRRPPRRAKGRAGREGKRQNAASLIRTSPAPRHPRECPLDARDVRFLGAKPPHARQIGDERRKAQPRKRLRERYQPMIRLTHRSHSVDENDAPARGCIAPAEGVSRRIGIRQNAVQRNLGSQRFFS